MFGMESRPSIVKSVVEKEKERIFNFLIYFRSILLSILMLYILLDSFIICLLLIYDT